MIGRDLGSDRRPLGRATQSPSSGRGSRGASARLQRVLLGAALAGILAICAQGLWRPTLWKDAEPRVMSIALAQYQHGMLRSLTFSGAPFLEKPPLFFDLVAGAFHVTGGPSVIDARVIVFLLALLWVGSIVLLVRRAAGARAGILTGALLVVAPGFFQLVRRIGVDIALVAMLSLSLYFLYRAVEGDRDRVDDRWWYASLVAVAFAALAKGVFGTFLFVAPTVAYAILARDRRVIRAFFRPVSIFLLLLPHLAWGAVLYHDGGVRFLFEHFVNNTVGRALHHRFHDFGVGSLPYGDVGVRYPWYYCIVAVPEGALPAFLAVPFALVALFRGSGLRARDLRTKLSVLALSWGVVPPLLLTFSSYKGRDHLGASISALVVVGAIWLSTRLERSEGDAPTSWPRVVAAAVYSAALMVVIGDFAGFPAGRTGVLVLWVAGGVAGGAALVGALLGRSYRSAAYALLAMMTFAFVVDFTPGAVRRDDRKNSMDAFARSVAETVGRSPVGLFAARLREYVPGGPGLAKDHEVGALAYWLRRPIVRLRTQAQVRSFLARKTPAFFVDCQEQGQSGTWLESEPDVGWTVGSANRRPTYRLVANRAAGSRYAAPPGRTRRPLKR